MKDEIRHSKVAALLIEDIREAKKFSVELRKSGIETYFYENLEEFWIATLSDVPYLCIVDVKMMSQGPLALKNHPLTNNGRMPVVFYYNDKSVPLVRSTYEMFHYGLVPQAYNYDGPLKAIYSRLDTFLRVKDEAKSLRGRVITTEYQMSRLDKKIHLSQLKDRAQILLNKIYQDFLNTGIELDFFQCIEAVFDAWEGIEKFGVFHLSKNGQKVQSAPFKSDKAVHVSGLWLGSVSHDGMEKFARNMVDQVAIDQMGDNLQRLNIVGTQSHPAVLIYVKPVEELRDGFPWRVLEGLLSGIFLRKEADFQQKNDATQLHEEISLWQMMDRLETIFRYNKDSDYYLLNINLVQLTLLVHQKGPESFFFGNFYKDLIKRIKQTCQSSFKTCFFNRDNLCLLLTKEDESFDYHKEVQQMLNHFSYWRYFNEADSVIGNMVELKVTSLPVSAQGLIEFFRSKEPQQIKIEDALALKDVFDPILDA